MQSRLLFSIPALAAATALLATAGACDKKKKAGTEGSAGSAQAGSAAAPVDRSAALDKAMKELTPSTLDHDKQLAELKWFQDAAKPFAGMEIKVVSETLDVHSYESKVLAPLFSELTGIKVTHDTIQE
ncbi:MAG TPA: hypothetical protein VGC42_05705, partial [Kofleriaceae bacterium]